MRKSNDVNQIAEQVISNHGTASTLLFRSDADSRSISSITEYGCEEFSLEHGELSSFCNYFIISLTKLKKSLTRNIRGDL